MDDQNEEEEKENDPAFIDQLYHIYQTMKHLEEKNMFCGSLNPSNILIDYNRNTILSNIKMKESYSDNELMQCDFFVRNKSIIFRNCHYFFKCSTFFKTI